MAEDQYRSLAAEYHWFFDDVDLFLGCDTPGVRAAMAGLEPGARVLDAACGIGVDSAALVRRGFEVWAADASPEMAQLTKDRLGQLDGGQPENVVTSAWTDLADHFGNGPFDAVFCIGNSIAHADDASEMIQAFEAFGSVLAPGGILVLDSHDWEVVHATGSRMAVEPGVVERNGTRCVRAYAWHMPERFGAPCLLEICPIFVNGDRATLRSYPIRMYPFTRADIRHRLMSAGFESVAIDAIPGDDRYTATARRPT